MVELDKVSAVGFVLLVVQLASCSGKTVGSTSPCSNPSLADHPSNECEPNILCATDGGEAGPFGWGCEALICPSGTPKPGPSCFAYPRVSTKDSTYFCCPHGTQ
jgi:hypothetical protein